MKYFFIFSFLCLTSEAKENISPFKKELIACFKEEFAGSKANDLTKIYAELDKKYQLLSLTLLERETQFKEKDEIKKLKYVDEKLSLYRVLDDETLKPIDNDTRQIQRTIEATISELLIHANIQSDWAKTKESRSGKRVLTIIRSNGEITSLQFEKSAQKKQLFCSREDSKSGAQDICSCRESK